MIRSRHSMPRNRSKRWLAVLLASALLHGVVLGLAGGHIEIPVPAPLPHNNVVSVQVQLRPTAKPVPAPTPVPAAIPPPRRPKSRLTPKPAAQPVMPGPSSPVIIAEPEASVLAEQGADQTADQAADAATGITVPGSSIEPAIVPAPDAPPAAPSKSEAAPEAGPIARQQATDPPPSVLLKYQVQSTKDGKAVYGSGKIAWSAAGNDYAVSGEASVLFFTVLEFHSEGMLDRFGVAPLLYTEKRFRKPATNTHFQREPKVVSFSASTITYPRQGGEQDRASIIWQLAALGRGNGSLFAPGAQLDVVVAGVRDAETWGIRVIGLESIQLPVGEMQAWHLVRQPHAASFEQKIDIWLAPQQQWYPVRLRYTDKNGDYLDMAASAIEPRAPPPVSAVREY